MAADAAASPLPALQPPPLNAPLRWLARGWRDFVRAPGIGVFYGGRFALMGRALLWVFQRAPACTRTRGWSASQRRSPIA